MNGLSTVGLLGGIALIATALIALRPAFSRRRGAGLWRVIVAILAVLVVYRFLNLEQLIPNLMRGVARADNVYDDRRVPQAIATSLILLAGVVFATWLFRWRARPTLKFALGCITALVALYGVRTLSLHMVDSLLYAGIGPIHLNWVVEISLLGGLCVAAILDSKRLRV